MERNEVERYSSELNFILSTPPNWVIKYGQLIMFFFFIVSLTILLALPNRQTVSFDVVIRNVLNGNSNRVKGYSLNLNKDDFMKIESGQTSNLYLYDNSLKGIIIPAFVDTTYAQVENNTIKYYVRVKLSPSSLPIVSQKAELVGNCTVETNNEPLLKFY